MKNFLLLALTALLVGCASGPSQSPSASNSYRVGPGSVQLASESSSPINLGFSGYSFVIPPFDPGIPSDPERYESQGVWPELRRTEAIRFPFELAGYLEDKPSVSKARIAPNTSATGHLYLLGEILESNGEDLSLQVDVVDIAGKSLLSKKYNYRVGGYEDPRSVSKNKYSPALRQIADDIEEKLKRIKPSQRAQLVGIEAMRFAEAFQPEYFSQYLDSSRRGIKLIALPAESDDTYNRIKTIRIKDELFIDNVQKDYRTFVTESNAPYEIWQNQAYTESKARREAKAAGRKKLIGGLLVAAVGVAALGDISPEEYARSTSAQAGAIGAAAVAVAGVATAIDSRQDFKDAKSHVDSLNEIGKSINTDLAPKVMEVEDKQVELTGTAAEQYAAWKEYLRQIYIVEQTPNREL